MYAKRLFRFDVEVDPKPETLNPKPETLNFKTKTQYTQP